MISVLFAICLLVEEIAIFLYNTILFKAPIKRIRIAVVYLSVYLFLFLSHGFDSVYSIAINILLFLLCNIFIMFCLYKVRFISAFLHALLISCISIFAEVFVGEAVQRFAQNIWGDIKNINNLLLLSPSVIVFFLVTIIAALIEKKVYDKDSQGIEISMVVVLSGVSFFATFFTYFGVIGTTELSKKNLLLSVNIIVFIFLLVGFLLMYFYMLRKENVTSRNKLQIQIEKDRADLLNELNARDYEQRILIHDIKNHLGAIKHMAENDDVKAVNEYITHLTESSALASPIRYCSNNYVNAILYRYKKEAEKEKIRFEVDSNNVDFSAVDDYDITIIMCNLLDNSIEAAKKCADGFVMVTLTQNVNTNMSIIKIVNSGSERVKFAQEMPISNKPDAYKHGLGIKSVKRIVEKYNGDISMHQDINNDFHVVVLISGGITDANNNM